VVRDNRERPHPVYGSLQCKPWVRTSLGVGERTLTVSTLDDTTVQEWH
jgi:hypothetical protein